MPKKIFELKADKAQLTADARAIAEANPEARSLPVEDQANLDKVLGEIDEIDKTISQLQRIEVAGESCETEVAERRSAPAPLAASRELARPANVYSTPEYRSAFMGWLASGQLNMTAEYRDIVMSTNTAGGFLVTPTQLSRDIVQIVKNLCFVRQMATIETVDSAQSLGIRSVTTQPSDAAWTTEIGTIAPDTTAAFGRRDLTPQQLTKLIVASIRMINASPEAEAWITERLGYIFSIAEENAYLNGTGSGQPLGAFVASANGIPVSRDYPVTAGGAPTVLLADSIVAAKYQVKQPYWNDPTFAWALSRDMTAKIRLLKDSQNRYLWVDGLASAPDTVSGIPVKISEYVPAVFTSGSYVGVLGCWRNYRIAEVRQVEIQRLVELFALNSEIGFVGRRWLDGCPVLPESWVRLKVA